MREASFVPEIWRQGLIRLPDSRLSEDEIVAGTFLSAGSDVEQFLSRVFLHGSIGLECAISTGQEGLTHCHEVRISSSAGWLVFCRADFNEPDRSRLEFQHAGCTLEHEPLRSLDVTSISAGAPFRRCQISRSSVVTVTATPVYRELDAHPGISEAPVSNP